MSYWSQRPEGLNISEGEYTAVYLRETQLTDQSDILFCFHADDISVSASARDEAKESIIGHLYDGGSFFPGRIFVLKRMDKLRHQGSPTSTSHAEVTASFTLQERIANEWGKLGELRHPCIPKRMDAFHEEGYPMNEQGSTMIMTTSLFDSGTLDAYTTPTKRVNLSRLPPTLHHWETPVMDLSMLINHLRDIRGQARGGQYGTVITYDGGIMRPNAFYHAGIDYENLIRSITYQMISVVHYLLDAGFTHADIKPQNFVCNAGTNKAHLIDYGLCQREPVVTGNRMYSAPERFLGVIHEGYDAWGLGAVLFELFTLHHYHERAAERSIPDAMGAGSYDPFCLGQRNKHSRAHSRVQPTEGGLKDRAEAFGLQDEQLWDHAIEPDVGPLVPPLRMTQRSEWNQYVRETLARDFAYGDIHTFDAELPLAETVAGLLDIDPDKRTRTLEKIALPALVLPNRYEIGYWEWIAKGSPTSPA